MSARARTRLMRGLSHALAGSLVLFLLLPPIALAVTLRRADLEEALARDMMPALALSLTSTSITALLVVALGTPLAWWLGRHRGGWVRAIETVVRLPAVTPPAVAGVALLAVFGRGGVLGPALDTIGLSLPFTSAAVVLAQLFVATPFYVLPLAEAFGELDEELLWTARSLGASPARVFVEIAVPICAPALLGGLAVAWARALGEFGATLMFAGNLPGRTQTLPVAIYTAMEGDLGASRAMAVILLCAALLLFAALRSAPVERLIGRSR